MKLKPYPKYKASNEIWLEHIPVEWNLKPLRALLNQRNEKNCPIKTTQILSLSIAKGVTLYSHEGRGGNKAKNDLSAYKIAYPNDIVINSMNVVVGAVGLSKYKGAISPVYYALYARSEDIDINFYNKIFSNPVFQRYLIIYGKGILIKKGDNGKFNTIRMKISSDDLRNIVLPFPSKYEQTQISKFLDWKTSQINRLIRNKCHLIELLKEQKQNIINQAVVTRGINPNIKLKPSGVEWIGDMPEHWKINSLKHLVHEINEQTDVRQPSEIYIALEHVQSWTGCVSLPIDDVFFESKVKRFKPNDILFGKLRPYLAKVARPRSGGVCVGEFLVLRNKGKEVSTEFLELKLRSKQIIDLINSSTFGAKMPRADWAYIGNLKFAFPPFAEQIAIVAFIHNKSLEIDQAISHAEREIELVREYQTRLISDVVTGKVDVRNIAVPEIPEEDLNVFIHEPNELDEEAVMEDSIDEAD